MVKNMTRSIYPAASYVRGQIAQFEAEGQCDDLTLAAIGRRFGGLTRERIHQILGRDLAADEITKRKEIAWLKHFISPESILQAKHFLQKEMAQFWRGEIDQILDPKMLIEKFGHVRYRQVIAGLSRPEKTMHVRMLRMQKCQTLRPARALAWMIRQELAKYDADPATPLSNNKELAKKLRLADINVSRYIRNFIPDHDRKRRTLAVKSQPRRRRPGSP